MKQCHADGRFRQGTAAILGKWYWYRKKGEERQNCPSPAPRPHTMKDQGFPRQPPAWGCQEEPLGFIKQVRAQPSFGKEDWTRGSHTTCFSYGGAESKLSEASGTPSSCLSEKLPDGEGVDPVGRNTEFTVPPEIV